jgi:hypothetical protein
MKKKTFASLSHSTHQGSLGKPLALIFLLCVLFVLAATQAHGQADGVDSNGPVRSADSLPAPRG